jgi:hypothetical protein
MRTLSKRGSQHTGASSIGKRCTQIFSSALLRLTTVPGLSFSQERTEKALRKIVLGLHYHHTGSMLPPDVSMTVYFQPQSILEDLIKHRKYVGRYGNPFSYAGAHAVEGDSVWWLTFYQSVLAIVTVDVTPPEPVKAN